MVIFLHYIRFFHRCQRDMRPASGNTEEKGGEDEAGGKGKSGELGSERSKAAGGAFGSFGGQKAVNWNLSG
jgi:hypothetical protein